MVRRNLIYGANLFIMENNGKLFSLQTEKTAYFFEKFQIGCLQLEYYNFSKPIMYIFGESVQGQKFLFDQRRSLALSTEKLFVRYIWASSRFANSYLLRLFCLLLHHIAKKCVRKSIKEEQVFLLRDYLIYGKNLHFFQAISLVRHDLNGLTAPKHPFMNRNIPNPNIKRSLESY